MPKEKGIIVKLPESRIKTFHLHAENNHEFSEPVPYFPHGNSSTLLSFIVEADHLTHIAHGHGGQSAGTNLRKITLSSIFRLDKPIPSELFGINISENLARGIRLNFKEGGLLTPQRLEHLIHTIIKLSPETEAELYRYTKDFRMLLESLSPNVRSNLAMQKEALLTAFLVAGQDFDRNAVRDWRPAEKPTCFLDGLNNQRLNESQMIMNDFQKLPGYTAMAGNVKGTARFYSPSEVLTVIYADKQPLEQLTGADLVYYNETYKNFIFVQYKALEGDGYRPNEQLEIEIKRMDSLLAEIGHNQIKNSYDFRLHNNPFFLKLCPRVSFEIEDSSLTKGMYIPLEYWKILCASKKLIGRNGGQLANFGNIERYITNTDFAVLVSKAWVGSDSTQSDIIEPMIKETLETGRAILYAVKKQQDKQLLHERS